jgi:hypothetical protein
MGIHFLAVNVSQFGIVLCHILNSRISKLQYVFDGKS